MYDQLKKFHEVGAVIDLGDTKVKVVKITRISCIKCHMRDKRINNCADFLCASMERADGNNIVFEQA